MTGQKHTIKLLGDGIIPVSEGQTILQASLAAGIQHFHACGGNARCSTCRILVHSGNEHLTAINDKESELRQKIPIPPNIRLACQTCVTGEGVEVHRMIRDETDIPFYVSPKQQKDLNFTGTEKELALFFLDIRDFTPFMESYLAFDVIHIMRRLFALFRNAIESHQGYIIETAGDGLYAVFGFDTSVNTAVENACKAGYQIIGDLKDFNTNYMIKHFRYQFNIGIGLHSGKVLIGDIGVGVNGNPSVMGLPVNIAARLQGATKLVNNNFVISDEAFSKLLQKPQSTETELRIKGVKNRVHVHLIGEQYIGNPDKSAQ